MKKNLSQKDGVVGFRILAAIGLLACAIGPASAIPSFNDIANHFRDNTGQRELDALRDTFAPQLRDRDVEVFVTPFECGARASTDLTVTNNIRVLSTTTVPNGVDTQSAGYQINLFDRNNPNGISGGFRFLDSAGAGFRTFALTFEADPSIPLQNIFVLLTSDNGGHRRVARFSEMSPHPASSTNIPNLRAVTSVPGNWRVVSVTNTLLRGWGSRSFVDRLVVYQQNASNTVRRVRFGPFYIRHSTLDNPTRLSYRTQEVGCNALFQDIRPPF